jgi:hypothetical protein
MIYSEQNLSALLLWFKKIPVNLFPEEKRYDESFLREHADVINWQTVVDTDSLSVDFLREFADRLDLGHRRLRNEIKNEFK